MGFLYGSTSCQVRAHAKGLDETSYPWPSAKEQHILSVHVAAFFPSVARLGHSYGRFKVGGFDIIKFRIYVSTFFDSSNNYLWKDHYVLHCALHKKLGYKFEKNR